MLSNTPEIWGGIECSFTRIKNRYGDQLDYCGHYRRGVDDIHYIAQLGIKALRYPIIWEKFGRCNDETSWSWLDKQLNTLKHYKIQPIAGLLHHGSGPVHAPLSDPRFAEELAKYAFEVATRFPFLEYFTPVNEPLTTARFCGLYGFWYPHDRSAKSFAAMLLNEIKAVVLSMQAIRQINPGAKLIQTEDLGKTYSTPLLEYQADFENERRWLTYDLLCGYVKPGHPMWDYFLWLKIPQADLEFFLANSCKPDVIGIDYYLTSERFLDQNIKSYPSVTHGSNGRHAYADVEAIRVKHDNPYGPHVLFRECWDRYQIPIAITEVHIHGNPLEQISWFNNIWKECKRLASNGVNIRAVTAWAMLGTYGWSKLLTETPGEYERGVYEVKEGNLTSTPYTEFLKQLTRNTEVSAQHGTNGWWNSEQRFITTKTKKESIAMNV
ncbi:MAG TPA: family 1 glycosylhydrolase [Chryseolinea sp.]